VGDFYGTGIKSWAGFGPIGSTEKKRVWADYVQLLRVVFSRNQGQKKSLIIFLNCSVRTKKLHKMKLKFFFFKFLKK